MQMFRLSNNDRMIQGIALPLREDSKLEIVRASLDVLVQIQIFHAVFHSHSAGDRCRLSNPIGVRRSISDSTESRRSLIVPLIAEVE
jgi:hypothetical protein